jgi:hypothetical protein
VSTAKGPTGELTRPACDFCGNEMLLVYTRRLLVFLRLAWACGACEPLENVIVGHNAW